MSQPDHILSNYDVFFILERELLYREKGIKTHEKLNSGNDLQLHLQYGGVADFFPPRPTRYESLNLSNFWFLDKTSNRKSAKGIDDGFSSVIASNWMSCDSEVKVYVTDIARIVKNWRDEAIKNRRDAVRLIQKTHADPSFQAKGVHLELDTEKAYFQSYFQSIATPCHSVLLYEDDQSSKIKSVAAFASGIGISQQILPSMKAATSATYVASLKKKEEATDTKAVYGRAFKSQPPNNMPMSADKCGMIMSLSTSDLGHTPRKRVRSNIKAVSSNLKEKEASCRKCSTIRPNDKQPTSSCNCNGSDT